MKTKDIKVGEVYAIGAPNASYGAPFKAKVVKLNVYGYVSRGFGGGKSAHANYVEIEPIEVEGRFAGTHHYGCVVRASGLVASGYRTPEDRTAVFRATSSHVLCTWEEQLEQEAQSALVNEQQQERRRLQEENQQAMTDAFAKHGITVSPREYHFRVSEEDAKNLLILLEKASRKEGS